MGGTVCCFESVEEESASLLQRDSVRMKRLVRNNELTSDEQFNETFDKVKKELEANINMVSESITETKKELKHIEEAMLSVLGGREADTLPAADAIDLQLLLSREDECNTSLAQIIAITASILEQYAVPHSSHPRGYFRVSVDQRLADLLGATSGQMLFGRCNELRHGSGRVLADVVEVLPRLA